MKMIVGAVALAAVMLSGCTTDADRCAQASNPAECIKWADAGGDIEDYLVGGLAGYALASVTQGGRQQTVIVQNHSYHGPQRHLRRPLVSKDVQLARLERKVQRQKAELRRQQEANRRYKAEKRSGGLFSSSSSKPSSSWSSSRSSSSSRSWGGSSSSRRRK